MSYLRKGPPSSIELKYVRDRLAQGHELEAIASTLNRKLETLVRHLELHRSEIHPQKPNPALVVTTRCGAKIEGLSLNELVRLARAL